MYIEISVKGSCLVIALTPRKRFGTPNTTSEKLTTESLVELNFNMKMGIQLKYGLAFKLHAAQKTLSFNVSIRGHGRLLHSNIETALLKTKESATSLNFSSFSSILIIVTET